MPTRPQPVKARGHTLSALKGQAGGAGEEAVEAIDRHRHILVGVAGKGVDVIGHGAARLARRRASAEDVQEIRSPIWPATLKVKARICLISPTSQLEIHKQLRKQREPRPSMRGPRLCI